MDSKPTLRKGFIIGAIIGLILFFLFSKCVTPQERSIHGCNGHGEAGYICESWFSFVARIFIILTTDRTCFCGGECLPTGGLPFIFGLPLTILFWALIGGFIGRTKIYTFLKPDRRKIILGIIFVLIIFLAMEKIISSECERRIGKCERFGKLVPQHCEDYGEKTLSYKCPPFECPPGYTCPKESIPTSIQCCLGEESIIKFSVNAIQIILISYFFSSLIIWIYDKFKKKPQ